ncbi:inositol-3-phosphate synthase [Micromonospora sp. NPDC051196]|uniref:inositol-3-phosphate synthase n=1 Tax=Micromonospora sp. NPDC051196 TaxID=3155281 RepID=UPI003432BCF9
MSAVIRVAVAGVGNNVSALLQGVRYYEERFADCDPRVPLPGVSQPRIGGIPVWGVKLVAAFDITPAKIGLDLADAVLTPPNNYPRLDVTLEPTGTTVLRGLVPDDADRVASAAIEQVAQVLRDSNAEVLLYSLPTGRPTLATAYAEAALAAGVAFVNCTPEPVAGDSAMMARYVAAGMPLIGDDLASHLGTSVVHRALLGLLAQRGVALLSSYQLNIGGNEDFRNLRDLGASKRQSKLNALVQDGVDVSQVDVVPSAGFVSTLGDQKVAFLNIEAVGWAGTPVSLDLKLRVQDSSNAAGVIIDLVRIAAVGRRTSHKGFVAAAAPLLKSPPHGQTMYPPATAVASLEQLNELAG